MYSLSMRNLKFSDDFEQFWTEYPRKISKRKAYEAWCKLGVEPEDMEQIISAVRIQTQAYIRQHDTWTYFKHPTTWLNQGCWDDMEDRMVQEMHQLTPEEKAKQDLERQRRARG